MSHYTTLVITPNLTNKNNITVLAESLLEPFDENIEVEPYESKCYCVGTDASKDVREKSDIQFGTFDNFRKIFFSEKEIKINDSMSDDEVSKINEQNDLHWKNLIKDKVEFEKNSLENHPDKNSPCPDCEECNGTGKVMTTYNLKSKWDWYSIGGRWDGEHHKNKLNIFPVKELIGQTFAIVTPDGTRNEKGKMGWFGIVSDEKDNFEKQYQSIIDQYQNNIAVLFDCHI